MARLKQSSRSDGPRRRSGEALARSDGSRRRSGEALVRRPRGATLADAATRQPGGVPKRRRRMRPGITAIGNTVNLGIPTCVVVF